MESKQKKIPVKTKVQKEPVVPVKKTLQYYEAVGRRKSALARVRLYIVSEKNPITLFDKKLTSAAQFVNNKSLQEFFPSKPETALYVKPFELTSSLDRFVVSAKVTGGGKQAQLEAFTMAVSRALCEVDTDYRASLKTAKLLTRDSRTRESRKVGTGGKARRAKQSPKR